MSISALARLGALCAQFDNGNDEPPSVGAPGGPSAADTTTGRLRPEDSTMSDTMIATLKTRINKALADDPNTSPWELITTLQQDSVTGVADISTIAQNVHQCFYRAGRCLNASCHEKYLCDRCVAHNRRRERREQQAQGRCLPFYVVGYYLHRCYGGPEEGGWYFDNPELGEVRKCYDWRDGLKAARELKQEYHLDQRGRHSVIGGPDGFVEVFHDPSQFPQSMPLRPCYE